MLREIAVPIQNTQFAWKKDSSIKIYYFEGAPRGQHRNSQIECGDEIEKSRGRIAENCRDPSPLIPGS